MIFSHSSFATSLQLTSKVWLTSLRFHFQNQYTFASKKASHPFKMDSQCDLAPKTFSRLQKNVQGCPKNPPGRFPDGSNSLEKSARHSKTPLQRLEDHPRHLQDAPRRLQDASKTPQDASKRPLKCPQTSQHACKSRVKLLKSAYHVASKVYCNEGCLDN